HGPGLLCRLDRLVGPGTRSARMSEGTVRAEGRERRCDAGDSGGRVLRGGLAGGHLDPVPARLPELSALRYRVRGGEHARLPGHALPGLGVVAADPVLLPGTVGGPRPGHGVHAVDRCVHPAHVRAGRTTFARRRVSSGLEPGTVGTWNCY